MSTRCNIIIKDGKRRIYLYHHHDGYPMGVGTELQKFLEKRPGDFWSPYWYGDSIANTLVKGGLPYPLSQEPHKDDEYEVTTGLHGDIEYCYVINCKARTLRCYEITWDEEDHINYGINWPRIFRRDHLVHIPSYAERDEIIRKYEADRAARTAAALI